MAFKVENATVVKDLGGVLRIESDAFLVLGGNQCIVPKCFIEEASPVRAGEDNKGPGDLLVLRKWAQNRGIVPQ